MTHPPTKNEIERRFARAVDHATRLLNAGEMDRAAFDGFLRDLDAWVAVKFDELHRAQLRNKGRQA